MAVHRAAEAVGLPIAARAGRSGPCMPVARYRPATELYLAGFSERLARPMSSKARR